MIPDCKKGAFHKFERSVHGSLPEALTEHVRKCRPCQILVAACQHRTAHDTNTGTVGRHSA